MTALSTAPAPMDVAPPLPRSRLGDLLVNQGKLTARDLDRALNARDETGSVLEQVLVNLGLVSEGDVTQAVLLLNSPFVRGQVRSVPGSFLHSLLSTPSAPEQRIDKLFHRFLLRAPAPEELRLSLAVIASGEAKAYEDLQWLLVNKVEFLFHY